MAVLIVASLGFIAIHVFISSTPLRAKLVEQLGLIAYLAGFSVISAIAIGGMIWGYMAAEQIELWQLPGALWIAAVIAIPLGLWLVALGVGTPNPTTVGQEAVIQSEMPARGIVRVTRHPFMVGFAVWALGHMLVNGDVASQIFFGMFFAQAATGPWLIDRKKAVAFAERWPAFAAVTSTIPFAAILAGRNQFRADEIGWLRLLISLLAVGLFVYFHGSLFGAPLL